MTCFGAENETRTRDPNLGKVMLYQLSYFRVSLKWDCKGTHYFGTSKFFCNFFKKSVVVRDSASFPNGPNIIIPLPLPNRPASSRCRSSVPDGCSRARTLLRSIFPAFL